MPLRIVEEGRYEKPVVFCDHCGKAITDVRDGNYQWMSDDSATGGATIQFTHKACCHPFEQSNPGSWGAMELESLFVYLANSLRLDWEGARKRAALLDSIGS
jgi:hypothetical protein